MRTIIIKKPLIRKRGMTALEKVGKRGEIDTYLTDQGLDRSKDYNVIYMTGKNEFHITLNDGCEQYASLLLMKFI